MVSLFHHLIFRKWGLLRPYGTGWDRQTMQDVKYVYRKNVNNYGIAWIVRDTKMRS